MTRKVLMLISLAVMGLVAWFFFAWLGLDRNVVDAAGESVGTGLLLLLLASIGGMLLKRG
ncbi:hypothetical protein Rhe02_95600 [Rhizocola hellebori]|uniref:Uncharacterized protein n=1 Tax=Rhizocola hellebori TaxID=1392758 RepID=A0A8J3QIG6_9ACTN|nr:hypothetical protein [Rhizocola hellebori]GIH11493.1 hypothetical protein Rhe02_95600 [Rhizocola hellebori]